MQTEDLFKVRLIDGLPTKVGDVEHRYHTVILRELTVGDERQAVKLAERAVNVPGQGYKLLTSDETYNTALTMLAIDKFIGDGGRQITRDMIDFNLIDKLSIADYELIQTRTILIESSIKLRHGDLTQQQFDELLKAAGVDSSRESPGEAEKLEPAGKPAGAKVSVLAE